MRKMKPEWFFSLAIAASCGLKAQVPAARENAASQDGVQGSVALVIRDSIAKQTESVQKQAGRTRTNQFFLLAPPSTLGARVPGIAQADCDPLPSDEVDSLIAKAAKQEDLDRELLRSVMKRESAFRPCALSAKGAMGLMQLMPATAEQFGLRDPFHPESNVNAGAKLLKQLLIRYDGDTARALAAYNAGPGKVDEEAGVPHIRETLDYIRQILSVLPLPH
jgi:soluble lytic murein transglycosylase-like protein